MLEANSVQNQKVSDVHVPKVLYNLKLLINIQIS